MVTNDDIIMSKQNNKQPTHSTWQSNDNVNGNTSTITFRKENERKIIFQIFRCFYSQNSSSENE